MLGVPREVIEHHLAVCPQAHPVKQKTRPSSPAAGFPRMKRRPEELCAKLRATASRMVTCTGVAQTASL
jgi:hypothetical protein